MIGKFLIASLIIIFSPGLSYCFDLYVHSVKAPLYRAPSMGSKKITNLKKGTKIVGIKQKANWYKVKYRGRNGWVYKLMVRKTPPIDNKKLFGRLKSLFKRISALRAKSRRRPSSYTTVAAARGLRDKRKRSSDKYEYNYEALEKIESIEISDDEAMGFLMQGISNGKNN